MKYDFDNTPSREGTDCFKYDGRQLIFGRPDVLPMWVADMDFAVAPCISEAICRRAAHPLYGYELRPASFYDSVVNWVDRRNGWKIDDSWVEFTPGVVAGFTLAIMALCEPGDGVVIQPPVYPPFAGGIRGTGRTLIENQLIITDEGYRIDFTDLDSKLAGARILILCNPHNPTGRVFTHEELSRIGELCIKHDVLIISDEIHSDLIQKPYHHIHIASLSEELAQRTVTFIAPSKTFNLAGLATSVAITPNDTLRRKLHAEIDRLHIGGGNVFGAAALRAAYEQGEEWMEQVVEYIGANMDFLLDFLQREIPSIKALRSQGTYMMWLDMRALGMEQKELVDFIINRAGLGLNDGSQFGQGGEGFMRINLATSRTVVSKALERLKHAVDSL